MKIFSESFEFLRRRIFLISWISLVIYLFYSTFIYYLHGREFHYLRRILGVGLCISRGTASVLNISSALVLLPLCKKLNLVVYRLLSGFCPGVFFFWLEKAKSFHMTVAVTLVLFAVIHSISHFVNLWNFSRGYDEERSEINFANYKNQNPLSLLMSQAGLTGVSMLLIVVSMALTSMRVVRRRLYNGFWYTHQLYMLFLVLLIVHPLSGVLKKEVIDEDASLTSQNMHYSNTSLENVPHKFVSIKSQTWLWMAFPLSCFIMDLIWRILSRNRARVNILQVTYMAGRTMSLTLSCPHESFACRAGQYVLLQCLDASLLEWHPFTVVKIPESSQNDFVIWIRVTGDWTEALERLLLDRGPARLSVLVDGPFSSPMEGVAGCSVAICVAAGVGITPFVALLRNMFLYPRSYLPGRIHLLWIVRHEEEITWLADLATKTMMRLRDSNRPDRLHIELYVTSTKNNLNANKETIHLVTFNGKGVVHKREFTDDERATLLTPNLRRNGNLVKGVDNEGSSVGEYSIAKEYPLLGCRVRRGRPHWDRVFGYWVHLYPQAQLNLYCCGPKKLVKLLRNKCKYISSTTKTKFTFVHEGFS
ncbi:NADPH oxidase 4-like [Ostrinia furnacalis]|uniref:NADPH oxidase 4-like n=1 Tax=Ostrinia furnacalis TaxID=93504 RepID=UPI00103F3F98|nr:NADPH oxidase 4-like [Ostrinia furnacalis]